MIRKIVTSSILVVITIAFWVANINYENYYLKNTAHTFLAITIIYIVFKLILEDLVTDRIQDPRTRYSFRRAVSILNWVAFIIAGIAIWVENTQTLLVSYGLIAAGVAVALQDFFKNIMGGIILFLTGLYKIGDRIELNEKKGDVIDIGIQYTTLLEIQEWILGDQPTGRLVTIPNGGILSHSVHNYTRDHRFIWDEISLPVTYDSDWKKASDIILAITERETHEATERARISLIGLSEKYYLPVRAEVPALYLTLTDNWIEMNVRYVTDARQRRSVKNILSKLILEEIQKNDNIRIASETMELTIKSNNKIIQ